jgi:hypothetical protein
MKSILYVIIKSIIQGVYKGTLFFTSIYLLSLLSSFFNLPYFYVKALNETFSYNSNSIEFLSNLNSRLIYGYIITLLISISLITVKNIIERKK